MRETLEFLDNPLLAKDRIRMAVGPAGVEDKDILVRAEAYNIRCEI